MLTASISEGVESDECPYCRKDHTLRFRDGVGVGSMYGKVAVVCSSDRSIGCGARGPFRSSRYEAVKAWNRMGA